jgi:hypothetical protein
MTNTDTSINANYKDSQAAFYAMRAGLEEARDRMQSTASSILPTGDLSQITLPTVPMTPGQPLQIVYITNPLAGEAFNPTSASATDMYGNSVFDDELCHESFPGIPATGTADVPCNTYPGNVNVTNYSSYSVNPNVPLVLQQNPLTYKWARVTLKYNTTFPTAVVDGNPVRANDQVCWNGPANQEQALSSIIGPSSPYTSCTQAQQVDGMEVGPVYLVTALAVTPQGSRRIGQYETAIYNIALPSAGLALDGPGAVFSPPAHSNNFFISGADSGATDYYNHGGPANTCTPSGPNTVPAISTGDLAGQNQIIQTIPPKDLGNYTGVGGTPSVVDQGPDANGLLTNWSDPSQLNSLVGELQSIANITYNCGYANTGLSPTQTGQACSPTQGLGSADHPAITFVNGDMTISGNTDGYGVLVVSGTLNFTGSSTFYGLVLVIGQGAMTESGGGSNNFVGSVFLANTNNHAAPYSQLAQLGSPQILWNGGGKSGIQYNSCWNNWANQLHYMIVASREEMY